MVKVTSVIDFCVRKVHEPTHENIEFTITFCIDTSGKMHISLQQLQSKDVALLQEQGQTELSAT